MTFAKEDGSVLGKCPHCGAALKSITGRLVDAFPDITGGRKVTKLVYVCLNCETVLAIGDF